MVHVKHISNANGTGSKLVEDSKTDGVRGANYQIQTQGLWSPQIPSIAKSAYLDWIETSLCIQKALQPIQTVF